MGYPNIAATFMEHLCNCGEHGYSQPGRWGQQGLGTCEASCEGQTGYFFKGDRDCSSAVIDSWTEALRGTKYDGYLSGATYTGDMRRVFVGSGLFEWHPMGDGFIAQRGDIYLNEVQHTGMCVDDGSGSYGYDAIAEFVISENGTIDGQPGDQTGYESYIHGYYDFPWDGILHWIGGDPDPKPEPVKDEWHDCCIWGSHGKMNQKWLLNDQGDGTVEIESAKYPGSVLDVYQGGAESGAKVGIWPRNGGVNQRWRVMDGGIKSMLGELWLDVKHASDSEGAEVEIWVRNDTDAQKWEVLKGADGYSTIINNHKDAKRVLDVIA